MEFLPYEDPTAVISDRVRSIEIADVKAALNESVVKNFGDEGWGQVGDSLFGQSP